jgi:nucleoid DNA-binding protein
VTKSEFIDKVADRSGLSKKDATAAVDATLESIKDALSRATTSSSPGSASSASSSARRARV